MLKKIVNIDIVAPPVCQVGNYHVVGILIVISLLNCRCFRTAHRLVGKAVLSQFVVDQKQCLLNPLTRTHILLCRHHPVIVILCAPEWPELKNCDPTPRHESDGISSVVLMTINYHFTTMEMYVRPWWSLVISLAHCIHWTIAYRLYVT